MTQPTLSQIPNIMRRGEIVTVQRERLGTYRRGEYVAGQCYEFKIIANVQPATGNELLQVPEGERHKRHFDVFSERQLRVKDTLIINELNYEVMKAEDWGLYCRSLAKLKDGQESDIADSSS